MYTVFIKKLFANSDILQTSITTLQKSTVRRNLQCTQSLAHSQILNYNIQITALCISEHLLKLRAIILPYGQTGNWNKSVRLLLQRSLKG